MHNNPPQRCGKDYLRYPPPQSKAGVMARIAGVLLPNDKRIDSALPYIFGIGHSLTKKILAEINVDPSTRVKNLDPTLEKKIADYIDQKLSVEGELKAKITQNIRRLKDIGSYRGQRHIKNLPVRGQRSRTNARTKRGKKVTVGSGRKKTAEKT